MYLNIYIYIERERYSSHWDKDYCALPIIKMLEDRDYTYSAVTGLNFVTCTININ